MNIVFQVLWVAAGLVGYAIVRRDPDRFTFDNPLWIILARGDLGYYDPPALATWIEYVSRQSGVPIRDVDALDSADLK